jgi:type I restriction enzyme S subunit
MRSRLGAQWCRLQIGEFAEVQTGGTPSRNEPQCWQGGSIPWVTTSEVNYRPIASTKECITALGLKNSSAKVFPKGTLLMAMYGQGKTRGQVARLAIDAATNQACAAIVPNGRVVVDYLYYFLVYSYDSLRKLSNTGGQQNLSKGLIESFDVLFPACLTEQHRIAAILRTWDEAIEKAEWLIAAKDAALLGHMHAATRDAELGALGDGWVRTTLGDATDVAVRRVEWDETATYRRITVRRACGGLSLRGDALGSEILTKDMYLVKAGDFVISRRQVIHGAWAMARDEFDNTHVSKEYACLTARADRLWMPYLDWLSRTPRLRHEAVRCSYGVDPEKMVLNLDWLLRTPLVLPATIKRQRKLAELLDTAQMEIMLLKKQRDALARQKRGLMQKLLTGEWQVAVPKSQEAAE